MPYSSNASSVEAIANRLLKQQQKGGTNAVVKQSLNNSAVIQNGNNDSAIYEN